MGPEVAPVFVSIVFFLAVAAVWGTYLLTRHRERMAIIEKGMAPEEIRSLYKKERTSAYPLASLKWGLVLTLVGLATAVGSYFVRLNLIADGAIVAIAICAGGIGLVLFYLISRKQTP